MKVTRAASSTPSSSARSNIRYAVAKELKIPNVDRIVAYERILLKALIERGNLCLSQAAIYTGQSVKMLRAALRVLREAKIIEPVKEPYGEIPDDLDLYLYRVSHLKPS